MSNATTPVSAGSKVFIRSMNTADKKFVTLCRDKGKFPTIKRTEAIDIATKAGIPFPYWLTNQPKLRTGTRGEYHVPNVDGYIENVTTVVDVDDEDNVYDADVPDNFTPASEFVPLIDKNYVGWGKNYEKIQTLLTTPMFFPIFITGLSGNGKTTMVEQICARNNREYVRVNINELTDEDDLIGGFRLVNGDTVFHEGPVTIAAKRGAVLLLDEIDLCTPKIMCLQPVLEGKPFFIKKINKWIIPTEGFTVVATGNTKGLGDDSGNFIGTSFMNEAMLDRFPLTYYQAYPPVKTETKILQTVMKNVGFSHPEQNGFVKALVDWAGDNRKTYDANGCAKVITTRRLVNIVRHFMVFRNMKEAVMDCIERFDAATRDSLSALFDKYLPKPNIPDIGATDTKKKTGEMDLNDLNNKAHDIFKAKGIPFERYKNLPNDI